MDLGWIGSAVCSMSPAICQWQTEVPKHQICSSSQISQWCKDMVISTILLLSQQYRAVHQHSSQWSDNRPYLGGEGGYRNSFSGEKQAPSESNSSDPSYTSVLGQAESPSGGSHFSLSTARGARLQSCPAQMYMSDFWMPWVRAETSHA